MNLANRITILRVFMIPIFLIVFMSGIIGIPLSRYVAGAIFILASLTDALDGYIARSRNMITNFGKFMDPLADKLLVMSAMVAMVNTNDLQAWVVIVILSREFIVTGFRLVAVEANIVIAASVWGKVKTITQMIMITVLLFDFQVSGVIIIESILIYASVILTIISGIDYLIKNKGALKN